MHTTLIRFGFKDDLTAKIKRKEVKLTQIKKGLIFGYATLTDEGTGDTYICKKGWRNTTITKHDSNSKKVGRIKLPFGQLNDL